MFQETAPKPETIERHPLHISRAVSQVMRSVNIAFLANPQNDEVPAEERESARHDLQQSGMTDKAINHYVQRWRTAMGTVNKPR